MARPLRAVLMAGFDSALKFADRLATALEDLDVEATVIAPTTEYPHQLSPHQVRAAGTCEPLLLEWSAALEAARDADIVVPIYDGSRIDRIIREVRELSSDRRRPVFGTAYIGMVLYNSIHGYLWRSLSDVIAVNSADDLEDFRAAARALGMPADNLVLTGLSLLPPRIAPARTGSINRILFADQPTVPEPAAERAYVYSRLADYARRHPDRDVVIRPRHRPGEATFHEMRYSPEDFLAKADAPANLRIDHGPIAEQLPTTDLVLSISSTAILEALAAGCRVAFVDDLFGELYLNHRFVDSGLLRSFDQIEVDDIGQPEPEWLERTFPATDSPAMAFARHLVDMVDSTDRPHDRMWAHPYQRTRASVPARADELARALGLPTPEEARRPAAERALRRLLRFLPSSARDRVVAAVRRATRRV